MEDTLSIISINFSGKQKKLFLQGGKRKKNFKSIFLKKALFRNFWTEERMKEVIEISCKLEKILH